MSKSKSELISGERSFIKGLSFIASSSGDANTSVIDVKGGKIVRIRPLHFDWKYDPKELQSLENGSPRENL